MTAKEEILALLEPLPPDASFDEISGVIQVFAAKREAECNPHPRETSEERAETLAAIREGQEDIAAGRYKTNDEVRALVRSRATKCLAK
jgi:predicted transcriptional regulator